MLEEKALHTIILLQFFHRSICALIIYTEVLLVLFLLKEEC